MRLLVFVDDAKRMHDVPAAVFAPEHEVVCTSSFFEALTLLESRRFDAAFVCLSSASQTPDEFMDRALVCAPDMLGRFVVVPARG